MIRDELTLVLDASAAGLVEKCCARACQLSLGLERCHPKLIIRTLAQWIPTPKRAKKARRDVGAGLSGESRADQTQIKQRSDKHEFQAGRAFHRVGGGVGVRVLRLCPGQSGDHGATSRVRAGRVQALRPLYPRCHKRRELLEAADSRPERCVSIGFRTERRSASSNARSAPA
jgi:hypothetical protein